MDTDKLAAREARRIEDIKSGLMIPKGPQRGDFKICRESDKILSNYRKFKDPRDRAKIASEYNQVRREYRKA